jgi:hypothetical protein
MKTKKTKKKLKDISDAYQFTSEDLEKHWELFPKVVTPDGPLPTVTQDEIDFYYLIDDADRLARIIKRMPTMGELREYWRQEAEKKEQERAQLEADWQARNAKQSA